MIWTSLTDCEVFFFWLSCNTFGEGVIGVNQKNVGEKIFCAVEIAELVNYNTRDHHCRAKTSTEISLQD